MTLLILGIMFIALIYMMIITPDTYSNWGEEYMDAEFEKQRNEKSKQEQ
jgi:hypothetical protein